jgi:mono/diheme cytochrome c family protein
MSPAKNPLQFQLTQSHQERRGRTEEGAERGPASPFFFFLCALRALRASALKRATLPRRSPFLLAFVLTAILCAGCHQDMYDQPRYEPLEASTFFADGMSARPAVPGTVARGQLNEDAAFFTGRDNGQFVAALPLEVDRALLERGRQRFNIYCAPCHARTGTGDGMIVRRGFRQPPSLHSPRLQNAPAGHYFDVMTNGFGAMPSYRVQIEARDRWAIVAYIRVLQMSQNATLEDVPQEERAAFDQPPQEEASP